MHKEILAFKVFNLFLFHTLPVEFFSIFTRRSLADLRTNRKAKVPIALSVAWEQVLDASA